MAAVMMYDVEKSMPADSFIQTEFSLHEIVNAPVISCSQIKDGADDELTSLTWLQDTNLLKNISATTCNKTSSNDSNCADTKSENVDNNGNTIRGACFDKNSSFVPYNPNIHVNSKPPYSFSCLIFMAIENSANKALPVKEIYSWILMNFPYFQNAPTGWKNSVRHNLSLNKCFRKVDKNMKPTTMVKGSYWSVDKQFRPNLLHALKRSAYQPYHHVLMLSGGLSSTIQKEILDKCPNESCELPTQNSNKLSPELFPYLSKRMQETAMKGPEVDAAAAMLAMKNSHSVQDKTASSPKDPLSNINCSFLSDARRKNIRWRERNRKKKVIPVITASPSEDHTYSASRANTKSTSPSSSVDEAFSDGLVDEESSSDLCESDNSSDGHCVVQGVSEKIICEVSPVRMDLDEEQKKIAEGADALLNLAGISSRSKHAKRTIANFIEFSSHKVPKL